MFRSDYTNYSIDNKDCYLSFSITECENVLYSELIDKSKNVLDCYAVQKLENSSYNISSDMNYNCHFVIESSKCIDSYFLFSTPKSQMFINGLLDKMVEDLKSEKKIKKVGRGLI